MKELGETAYKLDAGRKLTRMISSVQFKNFKSLENFSVSLQQMNILVGTNNAGKSTILDAFRILSGAYRYASRLKPQTLEIPGVGVTYGYEIPESSIPIALENVHFNYQDIPTTITYRFEGGNKLHISFHKDMPIYLYFNTTGAKVKSPVAFRNQFPLKLIIVPTLGPFEYEEVIHDTEYVSRWGKSHRAPRLFRNIWYFDDSDFEQFKGFVESTWPGMTISPPEPKSIMDRRLDMFFLENRLSREIFWAGYGFQIWLQLLTHIVKAREADILVVDEPEIYLHPDLQRKIIDILREIGPKVLIATHSVEIINEVEPKEVLVVDKSQKSAQRLSTLLDLQRAVNILGSSQNIHLTRLARGKKVLFVEGKDEKYLSKLASISGYCNLFDGEITIIPIGGFSQWERILHAEWAFSGVLGENILIGALLDRDYRCSEHINEFCEKLKKQISLSHVLARKEIENYLLIPSALDLTIKARLKVRHSLGKIPAIPDFTIEDILTEVTEKFKEQVFGQMVSNEIVYFHSKGLDTATIAAGSLKSFESKWKDLKQRLAIVPGKAVMSALNEYLQDKWGISITPGQICNYIDKSQIDSDLITFFEKLKKFRDSVAV